VERDMKSKLRKDGGSKGKKKGKRGNSKSDANCNQSNGETSMFIKVLWVEFK
jgi:hypothetical protein